ncbi:MAG TPA: trehalose-phosphatase [Acidimicrobiales bacterium]|nr:trehalose-phosphatase [Acidimicrobiales bacterium]
MAPAIDDVVATLRRDPARTAVLLDFDGTLAPIVEDPATSRPLPAAAPLLDALADRYGLVAVVSGRPASFLQAHLGTGPTLVGLYGLEEVRDGAVVQDPAVGHWRAAVDDAAAAAVAELPKAVGVEHKGLTLTLHVRTCPELGPAVADWTEQAASRWGLQPGRARMSYELHPPVATDKGTVVEGLLAAADVDSACFIGDDVGDLPAFAALDRFTAAGGDGRRIVVRSRESAPELLAAADAVVADPAAVVDLLRALVAP